MLLLTSLSALLSVVYALPLSNTTTCHALVENTPWTISNITAFEAAAGSSSESYISFHFCDVNPGLELETTCSRMVAAGSGGSLRDSTYYACEGNEVRFIYSGTSLSLERSYTDPCLGKPPYDGGIVGGVAATSMVNITSPAGDMCTQDQLTVKITMQW
ncbi:hypothetical protein LTR56_019097 [Elasticomyces elasticus]|nr:hypothetical protein LTR56_019097 [Elasticomyces elasticus]KAK3635492.1 hypothetical protein LTR22_019172 [Elasticomyces elasticus]KAK4911597.1 hypothetical protein LTR49_019847 [Elasticomyces elasticus]KAK5765622.1 hypothetical protein LTS12_004126 [Elasticomyces elasticus]